MGVVTTLAQSTAFALGIVALALGVALVPAEGESAAHCFITPAEVVWRDGPPSPPPGTRMALLEGRPAELGVFTLRLTFPDGHRIAP